MSATIHVVPVERIGSRKMLAFVEYDDPSKSGLHEVVLPVYPDSPGGRELRALRLRLGLGLRKCASLLGITAVELSGLERGSHIPASGWDAVFGHPALQTEGC